MTTITKERIELFIKNPLENGLTRGEQMELARIALASLEAEPVTAAQVAHAPVIIGVDPAYSGVDDAVIYLRQGLHSKVLWTGNKTTDDLIMAKRIADFEDQYQADAVFIDFGYGTGLKSIGDGWGRTWQLVPFGGASTDPQMLNKRGEMFNSCKTWLRLGGIPE